MDNVFYTDPGTGTKIGVDTCTINAVANVGVPLGKLGYGDNDQFTYVSASNPLPVLIANALIPVTGSVTVTNTAFAVTNVGTFAVQAAQSGTWTVRTQDGTGNALTSILAGSQRPLSVAVLDASGNQITSFGGAGGTASNYGSAFPNIGTAIGFKDSTGTAMAAGNLDASGYLRVNVSAGTGTLEAGGNLAVLAGSITSAKMQSNVAQINGNAPSTGNGLTGSGSLRITVASDNTPFTVNAVQSGTFTVQPGNTVNTTPWLANHFDPTTTTGSISTVDLVVSTATGQGSQSILTGTPTTNSTVTCPLNAHTAIGLQITGTWTGTLSFERSIDGGTTYVPTALYLHGVSTTAQASVTANCVLHGVVGGSTHLRVRATSAMTGTATIKFKPGFRAQTISAALLSGTNTVGAVNWAQQLDATNDAVRNRPISGVLDDGTGVSLTIKSARGQASSSGVNTIVAAVTSKRIRVLSYSLQAANANGSVLSANFQDDSGSPVLLSQTWEFAAREGISKPKGGDSHFYFQTTSGQAGPKLNLGSALAMNWEVTYVEA